jgi:uncharacterized LabA/DUF88 family protein
MGEPIKYPLVIVDGSNFYFMLRKLLPRESMVGIVKKLRNFLLDGGYTPRQYSRYYIAKRPDDPEGKGDGFEGLLRRYSWFVLSKTMTPVYENGAIHRWKGNADVDMGWDACLFLSNTKKRKRIERVIIVSGDRDLVRIIKEAHLRNIPVTVVASRATLAGEIRKELVETRGDRLVMLEDVLPKLLLENNGSLCEEKGTDEDSLRNQGAAQG